MVRSGIELLAAGYPGYISTIGFRHPGT